MTHKSFALSLAFSLAELYCFHRLKFLFPDLFDIFYFRNSLRVIDDIFEGD